MINQVQTIKTFAERQLGDIAHRVEVDQASNGDRGRATIVVGSRKYGIELTSAYIKPPLGEITMRDLESGETLHGGKSDALWKDIENHIRGQKKAVPEPKIQQTVVPLKEEKPADGRLPHLAQGVIFYTERNEAVGGMTEIAAMVTEVISSTLVSLTVFPRTGESFWRDRLPRRTAKRQHNCWDFAEKLPLMIVPEGFELPDEIDMRPHAITWLKPKDAAKPQLHLKTGAASK